MNAHLDINHSYQATYEVRDQYGQLITEQATVKVVAKTRLDAMMEAADKILQEFPGATNATCRGCSRI